MRMSLSGVVPRRTQVVGAWYAANATSAPAGSVSRTAGRDTSSNSCHRCRSSGRACAPDGRAGTLGIVTMIREALSLGRSNGARPANAGPSPAPGSDREDHQHGDRPHHRPAEDRPPAGCRRRLPRLDHRVEGGDQIDDRRKPLIGGFRQTPAHDLRQRWRDLWIHVERSAGCSVKTASRVASVLSPVNGRLPASIS